MSDHPGIAATQGARALSDWLDVHGGAGFDALCSTCGWGRLTVESIVAGDVLPDDGCADALAATTAGTVTHDMFAVPVEVREC